MHWLVQEVAVACTFWGIVASVYWGWMPMRWLAQWYVVTTGILMVNQARTLAAHRYDNNGEVVTADTQLLDSVTLSGGSILTICAAPVGLRFHALHHLLPTVPYHSLGALHRLLLTEFPPDSPYAQTQEHGIGTAVRRLFRHESLARKRTNLV
jgi:fatty acid desaturase